MNHRWIPNSNHRNLEGRLNVRRTQDQEQGGDLMEKVYLLRLNLEGEGQRVSQVDRVERETPVGT